LKYFGILKTFNIFIKLWSFKA